MSTRLVEDETKPEGVITSTEVPKRQNPNSSVHVPGQDGARESDLAQRLAATKFRLTQGNEEARLVLGERRVARQVPDLLAHTSETLRNKHILVFEDEYLVAADCSATLAFAGAIALRPVPTCREALKLVRSERIDAAVLDIDLSENERIYAVATELHNRNVPFLFLSAGAAPAVPMEFASHPVLHKTCTPERLVHAVELLLGCPAQANGADATELAFLDGRPK